MVLTVSLCLLAGTTFGIFLMALMGSAKARDDMEVSLGVK